ncbi:MAG: stage II sporulation protein M [Nanoarchaeota archaeon]|jgi:uncharacterized membrane protein SpoIIM required for sporulation|nr:stage II sporulation protein M [Nanoarchaeota archaeon]
MIDILFNAKKAERHPWEMMFIAIFYSSISILVGTWVFPEYTSLIAVFFTMASCLYVTQGAIKRESVKEGYFDEKHLLREHKKPLKLFLALFIGIVISFAFWTYVLPTETTSQIFSIQEGVFGQIKGSITGDAISNGGVLSIIVGNNLKVLLVSLIIALIYGAGAIFILTWNASIMGYVIGGIANQHGAISFPLAFTKYFLHGLPEMLSYFIVILAGGIIYTSVVKGELTQELKMRRVFLDVFILIGIAILLMLASAVVEVFISPLI